MKVLFLIQSCQQERYIKEENILRETYLKRVRKGDDYYFYRGGYDENKIEGDILYLKCNDSINGTFLKTIIALTVFKKYDYDFIVRINTSNWINMEMLYETLDTLNPNETELIGANLVTQDKTYGIPFLRGNFLILNRKIVCDLLQSINNGAYTGIDDTCIALNLCRYYQTSFKDINYLYCLKAVKNTICTKNTPLKAIKENIVIRCADYIRETNNSSIIKEIDDKYKKSLSIKIQKPETIETVFGNLVNII